MFVYSVSTLYCILALLVYYILSILLDNIPVQYTEIVFPVLCVVDSNILPRILSRDHEEVEFQVKLKYFSPTHPIPNTRSQTPYPKHPIPNIYQRRK